MKEQTAVEWLVEEFKEKLTGNNLPNWVLDVIQQAKEMEKEQIIEAVYYCLESVKISDDKTMFTATTAEQYYHETFKQQEQ
jgi:hypothetical protein